MKKLEYEPEELDEESDDGTMVNNVATLADAVVGHRIVKAEKDATLPEDVREGVYGYSTGFKITLDSGREVYLIDSDDCCAFTSLEAFLLNPDQVEHIITGVGTTDGYCTWHIHADYGDILQLTVGWSPGNPFYYGYGFNITVIDPEFQPVSDEELDAAIRSIQEGI
jgi:hypothetical protein